MNYNDWKLKLKYGILKTPYKHYTVIAKGIAKGVEEGFSCPDGDVFMSMKTWSESHQEAADMIQVIGKNIGFSVTGNIEIFDSEPEEQPGENPSGYAIQFFPFNK